MVLMFGVSGYSSPQPQLVAALVLVPQRLVEVNGDAGRNTRAQARSELLAADMLFVAHRRAAKGQRRRASSLWAEQASLCTPVVGERLGRPAPGASEQALEKSQQQLDQVMAGMQGNEGTRQRVCELGCVWQ